MLTGAGMGTWMQVGCKCEHKERRKKKTEEQAGMGSHRQGCGQVSGHVKEKKSEHCVTCRQTCVFPNPNKTCTCLCPLHLPTCTWMCVSHFFLLFFCLHLAHACLCLAVPVHVSTHLHLVSCAYPCLPTYT